MSSHEVGILLLLGAFTAGALLWTSLVQDRVGRIERTRGQAVGLQSQVAEWLRWDAALDRPDLERVRAPNPPAPVKPADRALHALVLKESVERNLSFSEAHGRLSQRATSAVARAFLDGRMGRAIRTHWRRRYTGPQALFLPWYYLIAYVRYGRRQLFLETLSETLRELRTP